jgi:hypothetical protein
MRTRAVLRIREGYDYTNDERTGHNWDLVRCACRTDPYNIEYQKTVQVRSRICYKTRRGARRGAYRWAHRHNIEIVKEA